MEGKGIPLYPPESDPDALSIVALLPARARRSYARGLSEECEKLLQKFDSKKGMIKLTAGACTLYPPWWVGPSEYTMEDNLSR